MTSFTSSRQNEKSNRAVGRLNGVLTHLSREETVSVPTNTLIGSSPMPSDVRMFGRDRNLAGVLIEPKPEYAIDVTDNRKVTEFRNVIWQEVEEANKGLPASSQILKEMTLVTGKEEQMLRIGKGTVVKMATVKLYESEIDKLYTSVEERDKAGTNVPCPASWSQIEVENWLVAHGTTVNEGKPVQVGIDLFQQGFDSLLFTLFKDRILGSLEASLHKEAASRIGHDVFFTKRPLQQLASHLIQCVVGKDASPLVASDPKAEIEDMVSRYSVGLGEVGGGIPRRSHHCHVVLLTGSTGGLGSYLLASLLSRQDVAIVYAFNRPSKTGRTVQRRQRLTFEDRGLDTTLLDSEKLVYVEGDTSQPNLSLDDEMYAEIRDSVTVIIHNAWRLNFNLALSSFEPHVRGMRRMIDLACASKWETKPRFLFLSSIVTGQGWDQSKGALPEEMQFDAGVAAGLGYGSSKYVSERILAMSGLPATSFRIGQVTGGAPRGAWSTTNWVPMFVKSSIALGALPEARGVVSWLPPHAVSDTILDVAFADEEPPTVVNLVHPRPVTWASLMQPIRDALYQRHLTASPLPLIPFNEWVTRLNACAVDTSEANIRRVPAIRLLNFMRSLAEADEKIRRQVAAPDVMEKSLETTEAVGFPSCVTEVAQRVGKTMQTLEPISAVDAAQWVDYWVSVGMFSEDVRMQML